MDIRGQHTIVEKITILIDNQELSSWSDVEVTLSIDSFDTVQFTAPFEPSRKDLRAAFQPFSYKPIQVKLNGDLLFTGTMVGVDPSCDSDSGTVSVTAYAKPGVLCDCTVPGNYAVQTQMRDSAGRPVVAVGTYPRAFKDITLENITAQLCAPFGVAFQFREPSGAPFKYVAIEPEETIHSFLVELAKQRGLLITNLADGSMLFWKSRSGGVPVVQFAEGEPPLTSVRATFSPQAYFSHVTGFIPAKNRKIGSTFTVPNKFAGKFFRPHACKFDDTEKGDAPAATNAKLGRMFANAASYAIEDLPTWRDPKGQIWNPNTSITLRAPSAMIYTESELMIRNVHLKQTADKVSASLDLCLPGVFSGKVPDTLPWLEDAPSNA